jgi:hypothetical protein
LIDGNGGTNEGDNDRGGSRRRLEQNGSKDTNHQPGDRVSVVSKEFSGLATGHDLGSRSEQIESKEEEVEEETNSKESKGEHTPFFGRMDTASRADFVPCCVSVLFDDIEFAVTKVERACSPSLFLLDRDFLSYLRRRIGVGFVISLSIG